MKKTVKRTQFNDKMLIYGKKANLNYVRRIAKKEQISQSAVVDMILTEARKNASNTTTTK